MSARYPVSISTELKAAATIAAGVFGALLLVWGFWTASPGETQAGFLLIVGVGGALIGGLIWRAQHRMMIDADGRDLLLLCGGWLIYLVLIMQTPYNFISPPTPTDWLTVMVGWVIGGITVWVIRRHLAAFSQRQFWGLTLIWALALSVPNLLMPGYHKADFVYLLLLPISVGLSAGVLFDQVRRAQLRSLER